MSDSNVADLNHNLQMIDLVDPDEGGGTEEGTTAPNKNTARKSTTVIAAAVPALPERRMTRRLSQYAAKLSRENREFLENFDPERSARERRKLTRKSYGTQVVRKVPGGMYDSNGVHIDTGADLCDCLNAICPGCHFPCLKCNSSKCGPDCRVNRKYVYDAMEVHGSDSIIKNPLLQKGF